VESSVGFAGGVGVKGAAAEDAEKKLVRNLHVLEVFSGCQLRRGIAGWNGLTRKEYQR